MLITSITHPDYDFRLQDWTRWRLAYEGGKRFINTYLEKLSRRESATDFECRKKVTYCPAFAKVGINEIRDSIYERMTDITRAGGSKSYTNAVNGITGGVDLHGSSMNYFMGCEVLPELLTMQKVGIYVDMPPKNGSSLAANAQLRPYIYRYKTEDIHSWICDEGPDSNEFTGVILKENVYKYDQETGFPISFDQRYRRIWKDEFGLVYAAFYNAAGQMVDLNGEITTDPIQLNVKRVPFVICEISESLMTDIADYQIALLNLASSDMSYTLKANFPFYTEQFDGRTNSEYLKQPGSENPELSSTPEIQTGVSQGRRYPKGLERPGFIHPSSEPLDASMQKQEQLKSEIRLLLKLTIANLKGPKMASAESKQEDSQSLEAGLSYIGLALEKAERKIAEFWAMYEGNNQVATVNYPENYSLRSEEDRQNEADRLDKLMTKIPSLEYQKTIAKRIARVVLGSRVSKETFDTIEKEIDSVVAINNDPIAIQTDVEVGLLDLELASQIRGYPKGTVEKAKADHAERLARIAESQSENALPNGGSARGVPAADPTPKKSASDEKKQSLDTTKDPVVSDKTRG